MFWPPYLGPPPWYYYYYTPGSKDPGVKNSLEWLVSVYVFLEERILIIIIIIIIMITVHNESD